MFTDFFKFNLILLRLCLVITFFSIRVIAEEEALDLEAEQAKVASSVPLETSFSKFVIMGRVDLTAEYTPRNVGKDTLGSGKPGESTLDNNHFLFFLKIKASPKTSFLGEFSDKTFFNVDYTNSEFLTTSFGKIIIPFGDTRFFHHFYGGIQGYSGKGVMLSNLWSSPGINLNWSFKSGQLDTYLVRGPKENSKVISLQEEASKDYFALGARWTTHLESKLNLVGSIYQADYEGRQSVSLTGIDLFTDYGAFQSNLFKKLRLSYGIANAAVEEKAKTYFKRGDYIQFASNVYSPAEIRLRYGTYVDDSRIKTVKDVHNVNVGVTFPVDVLKILAEYQWNFEAADEIDNDVARIMVSLDF